MKGKRSQPARVQAHNLIATVAGLGTKVIVSAFLHDSAVDVAALHPAIADAQRNRDAAGIDQRMRLMLGDTGFFSHDNHTTACEPLLLLGTKTADFDPDRDPATLTEAGRSRHQMTKRRRSRAGAALYRHRSHMIEPVFAHLFPHGNRHLHYRNHTVHAQILVMAAGYNLCKLFKARRKPSPTRRRSRQSTAPTPPSNHPKKS